MTKGDDGDLQTLLRLVEREGVQKTYAALVRVLDDPKAASTALASASSSMVKLFVELSARLGTGDRDPSEMTADEISERLRELEAERRAGATQAGTLFD